MIPLRIIINSISNKSSKSDLKLVKNSLNLLPNSNKFPKYLNVLIENHIYNHTIQTRNYVSIKKLIFCSFKFNGIPKLLIKRVENIFEKWEINKKCIRHGTRGHLYISPLLWKFYFILSLYLVYALILFYTYICLTFTSSNLLLQSFSIPYFI